MDFNEAMKRVASGGYVKRQSWSADGTYIRTETDKEGQENVALRYIKKVDGGKEEYSTFVGYTVEDILATDWIVVPREMTFPEIIEGLGSGKSYKRINWSWSEKAFISKYDCTGECYLFGNGILSGVWRPDVEDFQAKDWVEVDEED